MFDKLIGKKKKDSDWFVIPEKKYTTDHKAISKMSSSAFKDVYDQQEKYIALLVEKIQYGKSEYERASEKIDEMQQKNQVVNAQISRMTNEHEQLTMKFDILQTNLNQFSSENNQLFKKQLQFLQEQQSPCEKIKNLNGLIAFYRERFLLCKKIEQQNKSLKQRYSQLQENFDESQNKLKQFQKDKNFNSLIPTLLQQIQELKKNEGKSQIKAEDIESQFTKFEKEIVQKMKGELETASTLKSTEEEEMYEGNRMMSIELKRVQGELEGWKKRYAEIQERYQNHCSSLQRLSEQLKTKESEIIALKNSEASHSDKIQKLMAGKEDLKKEANMLENSRRILENSLNQLNIESVRQQTTIKELKQQLKMKEKSLEKANSLFSQKEKQLQQIIGELHSERQNRKTMQTVFSNQNNTEVESLLKIKSKVQQQCQQLKQSIQSLKKQASEKQSKIKKIQSQIEALKNANKRLNQQKLFIQENANTCLKISQDELSKMREWQAEAKSQIDELRRQLQATLARLGSAQDENRNFKTQTEKLFKSLQSKEAQLKKNYSTIQQLQKAKSQINDMIGEKEQDSKIRMRKYESELNQQRIKIESYNRKVNALETKIEDNKVSMDNMYEQLLAKDKKIVHMETKLKEYKYIIQVQKKEKQEIEESYQRTIHSLKPTEIRKQELNQKENVPEKGVEKTVDHEKDNLKNQILSIREQNIVLLSENESLRKKIEELQETIQDKSRSIRLLQQKRDQIMKQIEKMSKKNTNSNPNQAPSLHNIPSPKTIRIESKESEGREKKIAAKAHKGFDILIKLQHQLYRDFITVFSGQLDRDQVKNIEGDINNLMKRSVDMRDIFQDYL